METTYQVDTYGTVYKSNGATIGWKGSIGGLTADHVLAQIENHKIRGESLLIKREIDDIFVKPINFLAGMR